MFLTYRLPLPFVVAGMALCSMLATACKSQPEKEPAQSSQPAAEGASAKTDPAAPAGRAALCAKLEPAAAQTIGVATTTSRAMDDAGLPLRCIYNPDSEKGPWFEIVPGGKPEEARTGMEAGGSKITDLPELGPGAFTTQFSFLNWVVGTKGESLIKVAGDYEVSKLQTLWKKVADEL